MTLYNEKFSENIFMDKDDPSRGRLSRTFTQQIYDSV